MSNTTPTWFRSNAQLLTLLGNKLAVAAVHGRTLPIVELAYNRIAAAK